MYLFRNTFSITKARNASGPSRSSSVLWTATVEVVGKLRETSSVIVFLFSSLLPVRICFGFRPALREDFGFPAPPACVPSTSGNPTDGGVSGSASQRPKAPVEPHQIAAQDDDRPRADRVGGVPNGHFGGQLFRREPVSQQPGAGRKAHALKPPVQHPDGPQSRDRRAKSEEHIHQSGSREANDHKGPRIATVGEEPVGKLGHAVKHAVQGEKRAQVAFGNAEVLLHERHGDVEVLAHKVKRGVANDAGEQDSYAPTPIAALDGRGVRERSGSRRGRLEQPQPGGEPGWRNWGGRGRFHDGYRRAGSGRSDATAAAMGQGPSEPKRCSRARSSIPARSARSSAVKRRRMKLACQKLCRSRGREMPICSGSTGAPAACSIALSCANGSSCCRSRSRSSGQRLRRFSNWARRAAPSTDFALVSIRATLARTGSSNNF